MSKIEEVKPPALDEQELRTEVIIQVYKDGRVIIKNPEGQEKLSNNDLEGVVRYVYENLRDERIANRAIAMFKSRLG